MTTADLTVGWYTQCRDGNHHQCPIGQIDGHDDCSCPCHPAYEKGRKDAESDYDHHDSGAPCEGCNALWSHAYATGKQDRDPRPADGPSPGVGVGVYVGTMMEAEDCENCGTTFEECRDPARKFVCCERCVHPSADGATAGGILDDQLEVAKRLMREDTEPVAPGVGAIRKDARSTVEGDLAGDLAPPPESTDKAES